MSSQQLVQRLLCSRARVNLQRVRDGFLAERDFPNLTAAASKLRRARSLSTTPRASAFSSCGQRPAGSRPSMTSSSSSSITSSSCARPPAAPGQSPDRDQRDFQRRKGAGQGARHPHHRPRQLNRNRKTAPAKTRAPAAQRPARVRLNRAGCRHRRTARARGVLRRLRRGKAGSRRQSHPHHRQTAQRSRRRRPSHILKEFTRFETRARSDPDRVE